MLLLTEPGDTSQTLACRILGNPDDSYAKKLREMNKNTLAYTSLENDYYLPDQLIWCPEFSQLDNHPAHREMILSETQFIPSGAKANISKLQSQGVDVNDTIAAAKVVQDHNQSNFTKKDHAIISGMVAQAGFNAFSQSIGHAAKPAERFTRSMNALNSTLKDLLDAKRSGNKALTKKLRAQLKEAYTKTTKTLARDTQLYKNRLFLKTNKIFPSASWLEKKATKKGIMINDLQDVRILEKIGRYGRWAGRGCFAFTIALGISEVYDAYQKKEDWVAKAVGVTAEIIATMAAGSAIVFLLTPLGWVALAGAAVAEGFMLTFGGDFIENLAEKITHWADGYIREIIK